MAAGRGARARQGGSDEPKQFRPVAGVPVLLRAVRGFARHPRVGPIVVVLPPPAAAAPPDWLRALLCDGPIVAALPPPAAAAPPDWLRALLSDRLLVAAGGDERQQSVANGLKCLPPGPSLVLVHDAARPFVSREVIDRVLAVAARGAVAVPGVPLSDTVKETDTAGLVVRTVPRERLVAVQTPQAFPRAVLETAHQRAKGDGTAATDDATLCERLGYPVRVVAGSPWNIKITTPEDFALAEALAAAEATA